MSTCWWIDEEPWPGPLEEDGTTIPQLWQQTSLPRETWKIYHGPGGPIIIYDKGYIIRNTETGQHGRIVGKPINSFDGKKGQYVTLYEVIPEPPVLPF